MNSKSIINEISFNDINLIHSSLNNDKKIFVHFSLASRKRPNMLYKMFDTTYETADNPNDVAISVYFDEDDDHSLSQIDRFKKFPNTCLYVGPKHSYCEGEFVIGCLNNLVNAEWMCGSQDDTYIESKGWDTQLKNIDVKHNKIVLPSKYRLGPDLANIYENPEYIPQFFIPNKCWNKYSDWEYIPHPYDASIFQLLINNNWSVEHINMYWVHDRRGSGWNEINQDELFSH